MQKNPIQSKTKVLSDQKGKTASIRVEDLIRKGEIDEALEKLYSFLALSNDIYQDVILLQSEMSICNRDAEVKAIITQQERNVTVNRITNGLVQNVYKLKNEIPNVIQVSDLPVITHFITDQKDILEIATREILYDRYEVGEFLTEGDSGWYFKTVVKNTKQPAVLKVLKIMRINDLPDAVELERILKLKHRSIIRIIDHNFERLPAYVLFEDVDGTRLIDAIKMFGGFPLDDAIRMIKQLIDAFDYIRQRKVLHANIRPSKIYLDDEGIPMISSLDIINITNPKLDDVRSINRYREECRYLSPELLDETLNLSSIKDIELSDQFSFGLLLFELITGKPLFQEAPICNIFSAKNAFFTDPAERMRESLQSCGYEGEILNDLVEIFNKMLSNKPDGRFKELPLLLDKLNQLEAKVKANASILHQSFHLCWEMRHDLIEEFYERFFTKHPDMRLHFKHPERQQMMLRLAIEVVFDIEKKEDYFKNILNRPAHAGIKNEIVFKNFLEVLRDTVKDLLGDKWDDKSMLKSWNVNIDRSVEIIRKSLKEKKNN